MGSNYDLFFDALQQNGYDSVNTWAEMHPNEINELFDTGSVTVQENCNTFILSLNIQVE